MKISGLKDVFSSKTQKVDYTSLRSYIVQLQNGTINAAQFATNIKGLNIATQQEAQAVLRLNAELQQGLINEQGYKAGLDQISMSLRQAQISTEQLTLKTKLMQGAMKLAAGGLNLIIGMVSTIALSALTKAISDAVTENERLAESAKESAEAFNSQNDGLEELKQKYIEVFDGELDEKQKTEQLTEIKKELIEQYKIEENELKNINTARQNTIDLLNEEQLKNKTNWIGDNSEAIDSALKKINKQVNFFQTFQNINGINEDILGFFNIDDSYYEDGSKTLKIQGDNVLEYVEKLEQARDKLAIIEKENGLSSEESLLFKEINKEIQKYSKDIEDNKEIITTYSKYMSEIFFEGFLQSDENKLENITIQNINSWKSRLADALADSDLDNMTKENVQNLMTNALKEINLSPEIQVSPKFKYDEQAVNDAVAKVETMFNGSDADKSTIFDKIEKFEKAIENIGKNGFIERADYEELLEIYPELENVLKQTADGYNASLLDMENSTEEFINENINTISEAQAVVSNQKTELNKQIAEIDKKIFEARKGGYDNRYEIEQLYEIKNAYLMQNDALDETNAKLKEYKANLQIDVEKNMLDATTESIGNLNSSMKMLSNAFNEINENGTLSVDTLLTLIESGYATAIMYNNQTGAVTLNKKVIEELTKAKITAQIAELQSKLATSQHTKEIEAQIIALTNLRDNWNKIYDGSFTNTSKDDTTDNTDNVSDVKEDTTDYYKENAEAQIAALKHEYEIGNLSTENYYNQLLDLAKYYYEGKAEYLDDYRKYEEEVYKGLQEAQKERLENEKEKISEVNEENEKSLELIKAHLELENARKNKTIRSYSEETGFNYTTDEKDILDKKLALDKLIAETKERFIDNQIDEIDKMNFDALRNALNTPISIPTNEEIMQESYRQTIEYITNNNKNNNSNSYTINVDKIVTDNPQDFLNQLNELLQIGINNSRVGL